MNCNSKPVKGHACLTTIGYWMIGHDFFDSAFMKGKAMVESLSFEEKATPVCGRPLEVYERQENHNGSDGPH